MTDNSTNPGQIGRPRPGKFDSLTYSAWVRIDRLDRPFIALVLTNGNDVGEPHWQLRDDGRLLLGIQTPSGHVAYDSKPILNIKHLGCLAGTGYDLDSIAAVVIGATSFSSGRGSIWSPVIGCSIIAVLNSGLVLLDVSPFRQQVVKGVVILVAVAMDRLASGGE